MRSRADELGPKVRAHLLDCWLAQEPVSLRGLSIAVGELRTKKDGNGNIVYEWTSTGLRNYWKAMANQGILIPATGEVATIEEKLGFHARGLNLTGRLLTDCSLRTMLEPFLADPEVSKEDKRVLKEGLRRVLSGLTGVPLAGTKTDHMVLVAASRVAPDLVPKLTGLLRAENAKGAEYARVFRNCLRHAMAHGNAVAIFVAPRPDDQWTAWVGRHLPLAAEGPTNPHVDRARCAISALRVELEAMTVEERGGPMPATPDDLPASLATKAITRVLTIRGDHRQMPLYRRQLLKLGERGLGPYRGGATIGADLVVLADAIHWSPHYFLHSTKPAENAATWEALLATLHESKIAPEMIPFVEWVRDFSTLPDRELSQRKDEKGRKVFPMRRKSFLVEGAAELGRIRAFRAYLGAAVTLSGVAPRDCVAEVTFGQDFEILTDAIVEEWAKRVDANDARKQIGVPPLGLAKHNASTGLLNLIAVGGMIALMGFERSRHQRGQPGATAKAGRDGHVLGVDWNKLRSSEKTVGEHLFATAYEHSRMTGMKLQDDRGGALATTHKPKKEVFADTPTADLIPAELELLRRRIDGKHKDDGLAFDAMSLFGGGIVASGASRIEELAHMRCDRNFTAEHRADMGIYLAEWDRKGDYCAHEIPLNEALTPRWLIAYVLDVSRPKLLKRWIAAGNEPHQFVFMNASGRPFGDPNESEDGKRRDARVINKRKGKLIELFKDVRLRALVNAKLPILDGYATAGSHGDRGRIGNIGVNLKTVGAGRTGRLLGHRAARSSTVERSYSRIELEANRETLHDILMSRPWYARRYGTPVATAQGYSSFGAERDWILTHARDSGLSGEIVGGMLKEAMMRWKTTSTGGGRPVLAVIR